MTEEKKQHLANLQKIANASKTPLKLISKEGEIDILPQSKEEAKNKEPA